MDEGGASECGCADPSGLGCPCDSEADCGVGELGQNVCEGGTCQAPCAPDPNLMEDVANCGECGNACPDPQGSCQAGECYGAAAYGECFVPGGDVSCEDQCQLLGEGTVCSEACSDGAWAGFDIPSCMDAPSQTGTCGDLIANPFASAHCCCVEKLD